MRNFVRFHAIESEIELSQEFGENGIAAHPTKLYITQIAPLLFLMLHILFINFCVISSIFRNKNQRIPKISEKVRLQRHLLRNFH